MANHPYNNHREHQVGHRRVNHILKNEPAGAKQHASGGAFSKVTSKSAAAAHDGITGSAAPKRYARGGKVKHGHTTNVIVVNGKGQQPGGPMAGGPPMPAGGPPMPMPPPGAGGPPGLPPGMPMRKRGGKVMTAGAATGVGRLQKAGKK